MKAHSSTIDETKQARSNEILKQPINKTLYSSIPESVFIIIVKIDSKSLLGTSTKASLRTLDGKGSSAMAKSTPQTTDRNCTSSELLRVTVTKDCRSLLTARDTKVRIFLAA